MFNIQLAVYTQPISPATALGSSSWGKDWSFPHPHCNVKATNAERFALECIAGALQDKGFQGPWWHRPHELPRVYQARLVNTRLSPGSLGDLEFERFLQDYLPLDLGFHPVYCMPSLSPVTKDKGNMYLRGRELKSINSNWQLQFINLWSGLVLTRDARVHFTERNNAAEALRPDLA